MSPSVSEPAVYTPGSVYEQSAYLERAAEHLAAEVVLLEQDGAVLPLLHCPDGVLRTAYGMPRPYGEGLPDSLGELGRALTEPGIRLEAILSPLGSGPAMARQLSVRGGRLTAERKVCVVDLPGGDPADAFDPVVTGMLGVARRLGLEAEVTPMLAGFGELHRAAMRACEAPAVYVMDNAYFAGLAALQHFLVSVSDAAGVAAQALFLTDGAEAYLHLAASRVEPEAAEQAMHLAQAEGVREAARRGCTVVVLNGGRNDRANTALLAFKHALATRPLPRYTVKVGR